MASTKEQAKRTPRPTVNRYRLELPGGAWVEMSVSANMLEMTEANRKFVFDLVDTFNTYREANQDSTPTPLQAASS